MIITLSNKEAFKKASVQCYNSLEEGKVYNFAFEKLNSQKTKKQLGYLFGGLIKSLQDYYLELGENYSKEIIKEMLYSEVGTDEILYLPTGRKIARTKGLSSMTTKEAFEFSERVIDWIDGKTDCILHPSLRYLWTNNLTDEQIQRAMSAPIKNDKDPVYLNYIRNLSCIGCGVHQAVPHHIRHGTQSGTALKSPDWITIPLCTDCHNKLHQYGEKTFLKGLKNIVNDLDIEIFCKIMYLKYYGRF